MGQPIDEMELRRRAIAGLRDEVGAFGSGAPDSQLIRRDGLLASLTPAAPQRSLFNSVYYENAAALAAELDALASMYDSHRIAVGDDCCVTGVATSPERQGGGIAGWLLWQALAEARERGLLTASLQATRAGAPLYERLGFADFGFVEMWELRQ